MREVTSHTSAVTHLEIEQNDFVAFMSSALCNFRIKFNAKNGAGDDVAALRHFIRTKYIIALLSSHHVFGRDGYGFNANGCYAWTCCPCTQHYF